MESIRQSLPYLDNRDYTFSYFDVFYLIMMIVLTIYSFKYELKPNKTYTETELTNLAKLKRNSLHQYTNSDSDSSFEINLTTFSRLKSDEPKLNSELN